MLALCALLALCSPAAPPVMSSAVAAAVDGEPILVSEVEGELARFLGERKVAEADRPLLQAQMLAQLVDRRVILKFLAEQKQGATKADIDQKLEQVKAELARQNITLAEFLAKAKLDEPAFRQTLAWEIAWPKFLDKHLTDANLEKHFTGHRRDFDGSEIQAAHILWKVTPGDTAGEAAARQKAESLRAEIASGKTTFSQAAAKHSQAPTAANGGDIGWIRRQEPMPESFSKAAFALAEGELSPPVTTRFGVHVITATGVRPGKKTWQECRPALTAAVAAYLFSWAADRQRPKSKVEFTGAVPYFRPGTTEIVLPK